MENLKCVKCQKYLSVPIFVCCKTKNFNKPHLQCGKCCNNEQTTNKPRCYSCYRNGDKETYLERSSILIEKVILQSKYPCIYEEEGCTFNLRIDQKAEHENNECFYRPFKCSMVGTKFSKEWKCNWIDKVENFYDHFREKHADNVYKYTSDKNEQKIQMNFSEKSVKDTFYLFSAHFRLFWLIHQYNPNTKRAYWTIQYIGPKNKSTNFFYEFEFFKISDPIRKYKITEYCESHIVDHTSTFSAGNCVAISFDTLFTFLINGEVTFRFRVCKNNKSIDDKNIEKKTTEITIPNLLNITNNNIGNIIGSSPIATNAPPLNLPLVTRTFRSKSVVGKRRH
ncbi:E3 ubiquitin-protein ligase SIAH1B-like [Chrysoperla carnea]|uniref:E3 ubiquitin-protein ligase SIAH1B-like n=1 Tax=Chrysoperla carnea TaxID=189513 RepID=UPI001D0766FB|nr:E3 ubiquitin-protein ligase SIAH1B-like [Chrysoperla carnea]XP_044736028.1 E3 ubiquitin-protein ligase SIAH1B-like [Chrysoperla carnea]XP_044736030.1 E3 ubiquitin-protein ligase SIAH1B-like [Chrysoperla carnea]XP_044736031.1 E3 ubiquitin-protein ligase SIAH1B-like [Chrysoperla carnea]